MFPCQCRLFSTGGIIFIYNKKVLLRERKRLTARPRSKYTLCWSGRGSTPPPISSAEWGTPPPISWMGYTPHPELERGYPPVQTREGVPPPRCGQTCENSTFPRTTYTGGKYYCGWSDKHILYKHISNLKLLKRNSCFQRIQNAD